MSIYEKFGEIRRVVKSSQKVEKNIKAEALFALSQLVRQIFENDDQIPKEFIVKIDDKLMNWVKLLCFFKEVVGLKVGNMSILKKDQTCIIYKITLI